MPDDQVVHLRIPIELHTSLRAFAGETNRSMNKAVIQLLTEALNARARGSHTPPHGTAFTTDPTHTR